MNPAATNEAMIDVFADVVCPFTHIGLRGLVERRREFGSSTVLRVRGWPLELVNGAPLAADVVAEEIRELRRQVAPDLFAGSIRRGSRRPRSPR